MPDRKALLRLLSDGSFHSGEALGEGLGVSRAAVWKSIQGLIADGLNIHAVTGRGYRLASRLDLLDQHSIVGEMNDAASSLLSALDIHDCMDSTSRYLLEKECRSGHVCIAEQQTAGKGRRGRAWISPYGASINMSIAWRYEQGPAVLSGLSLAIGVAVARTLEGMGATGIGLKWPNDIFWKDRKLGGILIEVTGESNGPCQVVTGIGLNINLPQDADHGIEQPWANLTSAIQTASISRNHLIALLLNDILPLLAAFNENGLGPLLNDWKRFDICYGRQVNLHIAGNVISGKVLGINANGALMLEDEHEVREFQSGEVSLRLL